MKKRFVLLAAVVFLLAAVVNATPVTNQTLDCPSCVGNTSNGSIALGNNSTAITGWTVGTPVLWVEEYNAETGYGWQSADGQGSVVGLNANYEGTLYWGSISQMLTGLTPNTTYTLFYSLSAAPGGKLSTYTPGNGAYGYGYRQVNVQVGGTAAEIVTYSYQSDNSRADMNWEQHTYVFTTGADQTEALLTFQSASTGVSFGAAIDDVYFNEGSVPEPSTFSLLVGAGLAGLAFLKFRK